MDTLNDKWRELHSSKPDIREDEYSPAGLSELLGIPEQVILHEISTGDLKATRLEHRVVCISRHDALDWMNRRGGV